MHVTCCKRNVTHLYFRDNVVWDEEQERDAKEKVSKNSQRKVANDLQGKYHSVIE